MSLSKSSSNPNNILSVIDIGTTKICVLIAQKISQNHIEIIGIGKSKSNGLARGVVVDISKTVESVKTAVKEAELMSGISIESAYIGISGKHIETFNSQGVVGIKHKEISKNDINHVVGAARAVPLPDGQKILHVIPQFFTIDGNHTVLDPLGMNGVRLEALVHIVTGSCAAIQNLVRCCEMADVKVINLILEPLASAEAILSEDEQKLGALLLDIGGGTSDLILYQEKSIHHTKIIPIAGNLFTNDIALCLRTTLKDAERIKKEHGYACKTRNFQDEKIEIEKIQGGESKLIKKSDLVKILEPRTRELFKIILKEINFKIKKAPTGLVLTGGGSLLKGIKNIAEETLKIPTRIGVPKTHFGFQESLENPTYATSCGLLLYILKKYNTQHLKYDTFINQTISRVKNWFNDLI